MDSVKTVEHLGHCRGLIDFCPSSYRGPSFSFFFAPRLGLELSINCHESVRIGRVSHHFYGRASLRHLVSEYSTSSVTMQFTQLLFIVCFIRTGHYA